MKLLVYEFVTGGGFFSWKSAPLPSGSLLAEGAAMLDSLLEDLVRCGHTVVTFRDSRLPPLPSSATVETLAVGGLEDERHHWHAMASQVDGVILIAPETRRALEMRAQWVLDAGGRLLSPSPEFIARAADKHQCCELLADTNVAVPQVFEAARPDAGPWPLISKPADGCGSAGIRIVHSLEEAVTLQRLGNRVEHPLLGWPISVGVLCGPKGFLPLSVCEQHLKPNLAYVGGATPISRPALSVAAQTLAVDAIRSLAVDANPIGFVGVDLVASSDQLAVVEVNPRLTTSYVGLSIYFGARDGGLAGALLQVAMGDPPDRVQLSPVMPRVRWTASGFWETVDEI